MDTSRKELNPDLFEQREGYTRAQELADMFRCELGQGLEDVVLDIACLEALTSRCGLDHGGCEVGVVNRVMDGYGDFKASVVGDDAAGNTCPHGLRCGH